MAQTRRHELAILVLGNVGVFVLLCLIIEAMARLFFNDPYSPYPMAPSDYLPFTTPKSMAFRHRRAEFDVVYHFDEDGFRSSSVAQDNAVRRSRLLALGDSFTLGWGLDYAASFVGRLQTLVPRYQWLNAAYTAGYSPDAYYAYLARNGERLRITRSVVFVYDGNDLDDIRDNRWLEMDERGGPVRLMTTRRYIDFHGYPIPVDGRFDLLQMPILRDSRAIRRLYQRLGSSAPPPSVPDGEMDMVWLRFEAAVVAISRFCAVHHVVLDYVVLPAPPLLRKDTWPARHQRMIDTLRRIPARVLNLEEHLSAAAYFPKDGHLNPRGAQIVAEAVAESIARAGEPHDD